MSSSVGSAIEKIKLQELDNNSKLKERREYEAVVFNINRAIKDAIQHNEKSDLEEEQLKKKVDQFRSELIVEQTRRDALIAQKKECLKELEVLRNQSEKGIAQVWELRSSLCTAVQEVADDCDIRALLIKPMCPDYVPPPVKKYTEADSKETSSNEDRLKVAIERRERAIKERIRLQSEPDVGEEFVRIKNALQYSLDMVAKLRK